MTGYLRIMKRNTYRMNGYKKMPIGNKPINIALLDLNHMTMGVHTNTVPLGLGLIAHYLKNNLAGDFDIRIFKNPARFLEGVKNWQPQILGITQYVWNSELNLYMARLVKENNPSCLVVAGGPNLYLSAEEKFHCLKEAPFVDICVSYDGEVPFAEIVRRFTNGERVEDIRNSPVAGTYALDASGEKLIEPALPAPRLSSLDSFKAIYSEGFFDNLLNEGFHPFLQTQRGCPFRCTYCHTGDDYYSQMIFQSADYFRQEMEYLGRCFAGKHNVILYLANTNFGLYKQDFEIAAAIRQAQEKYDWPKNINVNFASKPDKLLELVSILKYKFVPAISLQTLTPKVLKNIRRKNIPFKEFTTFQKKVIKTIGENPSTELILGLPGETKKSFLKTVTRVLNSGVQDVTIYTLMALRGTPIASAETIRRYGFVLRHRLVPRSFSEFNGEKIFDIEQVVAETKDMPFEDYLFLRGLALAIFTFSSSIELFPVRKFLMEYGLDISRWVFGIHDRISEFKNLHSVYQSFLEATQGELFTSREELKSFFKRQENYGLLFNGRLGDNLLRRFRAIIISQYYNDYLSLALSELKNLSVDCIEAKKLNQMLKDLKLYLESRDIGYVFQQGYSERALEKFNLRFNIPEWLEGKKKNARLEDYQGEFSYSTVITDYMRNRLKDFRLMNRDAELSLQILYRDGYIKDFWPVWIGNREEK